MGFLEQQFGQKTPFTFPVPSDLQSMVGTGSTFTCRFADDTEDFEEFMSWVWQMQALKIRTVKGE